MRRLRESLPVLSNLPSSLLRRPFAGCSTKLLVSDQLSMMTDDKSNSSSEQSSNYSEEEEESDVVQKERDLEAVNFKQVVVKACHFDLDAVDFEPLVKTYSGAAISYHTQPEHADEVRSLASLGTSTRSVCSPKSRKREQRSKNSDSSHTPLMNNRQKKDSAGSSSSSLDGYHYVVVAMGMFILMVLVNNMLQQPNYFHTKMATILPKEMQDYIKKVYPPPVNTMIPSEIRTAFKDVDELPIGVMDTPLLWKIPRSGTTTLQLCLSMCMGRVVASEQGAEHRLDKRLNVMTTKYGNFLNVDPSTPLGIEHASELGLIPSRMADVVITPHLYLSTKLFDTKHKGRLFTFFRHPVDRLISLYYFLRVPEQGEAGEIASAAVASSSSGVNNANNMTLEEFALDSTDNWHVRMLTNALAGPVTLTHLDTAKEILRTKFLIGLLEKKTESLRRIETYFGWKIPSKVAQTCKNDMFYFEPLSKNPHPPMDHESRESRIFLARNQLDIDLYQYAKLLFTIDQKKMIAKMKGKSQES